MTTHKDSSHRAWSSQAGVSLISVMVVAAFIGIFVAVISGSLSKSIFVRRLLATGDSYRDLETAFQAGIAVELRRLLNPTSGTCAGGALSIKRNVGLEGVSYSTKTSMPAWPSDAPAGHLAASKRCNSGSRAPPSSGDFYFCLQFAGIGNTQFSGFSFNGAPMAIAEVRAKVIDLSSGAPLSCAAYQTLFNESQAAPGTTGQTSLEVLYSIYWYGRGTPRVYERRNGSFYAPAT